MKCDRNYKILLTHPLVVTQIPTPFSNNVVVCSNVQHRVSPPLRSLEVCLCTKIHVSRVFYRITAQYCDGAVSEHWGWGDGWGRYGELYL